MIHFSHGCSLASDKHFPIFRVPGTAIFFSSGFCTWSVWWSNLCWTLGGDLVCNGWDFCTSKKMFTVTVFSAKVLFMLLVE